MQGSKANQGGDVSAVKGRRRGDTLLDQIVIIEGPGVLDHTLNEGWVLGVNHPNGSN